MNYKQFEGHTPGPWFSHDALAEEWRAMGQDQRERHTIPSVEGYTPSLIVPIEGAAIYRSVSPAERKANEALMAAAPVLLKANMDLREAAANALALLVNGEVGSDSDTAVIIEELRRALD